LIEAADSGDIKSNIDMKPYIFPFAAITMNDLTQVGGKNASLGEMIQHLSPQGISVPDGFALGVNAYHHFIKANTLGPALASALEQLNPQSLDNLPEIGTRCRELVSKGLLPQGVKEALRAAYQNLVQQHGADLSLAVRSS